MRKEEMKKKKSELSRNLWVRLKNKSSHWMTEKGNEIRGDVLFLKKTSHFSWKKALGGVGLAGVLVVGVLLGRNNSQKVQAITLPSGGGVNYSYSGSGNINWSDGESTLANNMTIDGQVAFCINPFVDVFQGAYATQAGQNDAAHALFNQMTPYQQKLLNNVTYIGMVNNAQANPNMDFATQLLLAMIQAGQNGISGTINPTPTVDTAQLKNVLGGRTITGWTSTGATGDAITYAQTIMAQAAAMGQTPKFNPNPLKIIAGRSATTTDVNGVLAGGAGGYSLPYDKIFPSNGLTVKVNGNSVSVSASTSASGAGTVGFKTRLGDQAPQYIYGTINPDGTVGQELFATTDPAQTVASLDVQVIPLTSHQIKKTGTDAGGQQDAKPIPGTKFTETVYSPDGSIDTGVDGAFDTVDAQGNKTGTVTFKKGVAQNITTGTDGTVTIKNYAPEGDTFKDVETYVPAPYVLGHTNSQGNLVNDPITGTYTSSGLSISTFTDTKQVGAIKLHKSGTLSGNDMLNSEYSLAGMVFGIKDSSGNIVAQMTTDANGDAVSNNTSTTSPLIVDGKTKYTVYEISVPDTSGFVSTFKPVEVTFKYAGETVVINYENANGENQEVTISDKGEKHDAATDANANGDETLQGTQFGYHYAEDVKDSKGQLLHHKDDFVKMKDGFTKAPITITQGTLASTDESLIVQVDKDNLWSVIGLPKVTGGYYRQEVQSGWGEVLSTEKYYFGDPSSDEMNANQDTGVVDENVKPVNDTMIYGLAFQKMFENNGSLTGENGAKFLFKSENGKFEQEAVSGDSTGFDGFTTPGMVKVSGIPIGKTSIHQTFVPEGTLPVDDMEVDFGPATTNGAPDEYTVTITWASGSNKGHVIYTKTMPKDQFIDQAVMFNVNLGVLTDKPVTPPELPATIQGMTQVQQATVTFDKEGKGTVKDLYQAIASGTGEIEGSEKGSKIGDELIAKVVGVYNQRTKEVIPAMGEAKLITASFTTKQAMVDVTFNRKDAKKGIEASDSLTMLEELYDKTTDEVLKANTSDFESMTPEQIVNETVNVEVPEVKRPTIKTKAHTTKDGGEQTYKALSSKAKAYDDVMLTHALKDQQLVSQLHYVIKDEKGNVKKDMILKTLHFTIDDATAKAQMKTFETQVDLTKLPKGGYLVWTEELFAPKADINTAKPLVKYNDLNNKDESLYLPAPTIIEKLLPDTGEKAGIWLSVLGIGFVSLAAFVSMKRCKLKQMKNKPITKLGGK
jgi:LPXTG-motif cell wall-anchored protein